MRGTIKKRYKGSWSLILDLGYQADPATGTLRRRQKWVTFRGTRKAAETKLTELVRAADRQEFVEPTKLTLGDWLDDWLAKAIKPRLAARTYIAYRHAVEAFIKPALGALRLQTVTPLDLDSYYASLTLAPATQQQHHAILSSALKAAVRANLTTRNVATLVDHKPRAAAGHEDVLTSCWTAAEAAKFITAAKAAGPQWAAFFGFALDTGARRGELCGLRWDDLDLDARKVTIQRQLVAPGPAPTFAPPKTKRARTVDLSADTVTLLRAQKRRQAELKLAAGGTYRNLGLVFAKETGDVARHKDAPGDPLAMNHINEEAFAHIVAAAGVRKIRLHGLRHTSASLLLQAGVPAHVVQRRLGHSKIEMTLNIYSHVLPEMAADAADRLAALLHAGGSQAANG